MAGLAITDNKFSLNNLINLIKRVEVNIVFRD